MHLKTNLSECLFQENLNFRINKITLDGSFLTPINISKKSNQIISKFFFIIQRISKNLAFLPYSTLFQVPVCFSSYFNRTKLRTKNLKKL